MPHTDILALQAKLHELRQQSQPRETELDEATQTLRELQKKYQKVAHELAVAETRRVQRWEKYRPILHQIATNKRLEKENSKVREACATAADFRRRAFDSAIQHREARVRFDTQHAALLSADRQRLQDEIAWLQRRAPKSNMQLLAQINRHTQKIVDADAAAAALRDSASAAAQCAFYSL